MLRLVKKRILNGLCVIVPLLILFLVRNRIEIDTENVFEGNSLFSVTSGYKNEARVTNNIQKPSDENYFRPNKGPLLTYTVYTAQRLGLKPLSVPPVNPKQSEPVFNDVLSFKYPVDIENLKCQQWKKQSSNAKNRTTLIVTVSAAENWAKRDLIRQTWAGSQLLKADWAQLVFLIGSPSTENRFVKKRLEKERLEHGDLVQVNVVDTYTNLTLKSIALLHWTHTHCPEAELVLKCDDDNYINVNVLMEILPSMNDTRSIYGTVVPTLVPERFRSQKHFVSRHVWPWTRYPAYVMGGCYAITGQAVEPLLAAAQTTPIFYIEDIYITGLCAHKVNVTLRTHLQQFYHPSYLEKDDLEPCFVRETAVWQTRAMNQMVLSNDYVNQVYQQELPCIPIKKKTKCRWDVFCRYKEYS